MSRRLPVLLLIGAFLLPAGCGSSKHSSSGTRSGASTASSAPGTTSTTSTSAPGTTVTGNTQPGSAGARNARVPATFVIHAGDKLTPPVISIPAFLAIQLTAISADGRPHTIGFHGRASVTFSVPAGGRGSTLLAGLRAGRYPVLVDGASHGSLVIGGEPGP